MPKEVSPRWRTTNGVIQKATRMLRLKYDQLLSTLLAISDREISERLGFSVDVGTAGTTLLSIMIVNLAVRYHPYGRRFLFVKSARPGDVYCLVPLVIGA